MYLKRTHPLQRKMEPLLRQVLERLKVLETKVDTLGDKFTRLSVQEATKKEQNALRRQLYREERAKKMSGKIPLPTQHCMERRDRRIDLKVFVDKGVEFGRARLEGTIGYNRCGGSFHG